VIVRTPTNDGSFRHYIGSFPSFRLGIMIPFASLLERDYLCHLEFDHLDVSFFKAQPCRIYYRLDGRKRRYTPDFHVVRKNKQQIIEVKTEEQAQDEKNRQKYLIAAQSCSRKGYEFLVVTDSMIRVQPLLDNIKLLLWYQRIPIYPQHQVYCQEFFTERREASLAEVMDFLATKDVDKQTVYSLIRWGVFGVNLSEPICKNSLVFLPGEAK